MHCHRNPGDNTANAIDHYLTKWNEILWEVYPDYVISGGSSILGAAVAFDQTFILQQVIEAFEASAINYDIRGIAHNLAVDETKIITNTSGAATVTGTDSTDYIYITPGDHIINGGANDNFKMRAAA